mmetsp:Transcript_14618/g.23731  ORF Transcript_14618/g.23731 Transcript_14618/m.23731 type:complete len:123 (-) Transcript_14618:209-577(-)
MGCASSSEAITAAEEARLGPPSKTQDASEHAQQLVMLVKPTIEVHLETMHLDHLKATQMITRACISGDDGGTMFYVKCRTNLDDNWPWIFVKLYEPPVVTDVSPVQFKEMKKMDQEYKLVTF